MPFSYHSNRIDNTFFNRQRLVYKSLIRLYLRNRKSPPWFIQTRSVARMQLSNELKFVEISLVISEQKKSADRKSGTCRLGHLYSYISGTGSGRHIYLHLICGHIVAFKRALICRNRFSHLWENCARRKNWDLSVTSLIRLYLRNRKCSLYFIYTWSVAIL